MLREMQRRGQLPLILSVRMRDPQRAGLVLPVRKPEKSVIFLYASIILIIPIFLFLFISLPIITKFELLITSMLNDKELSRVFLVLYNFMIVK